MTMQCATYGRLGKDPESKTTRNDKAMATASIAVDVTPGNSDQQEITFFESKSHEDLSVLWCQFGVVKVSEELD